MSRQGAIFHSPVRYRPITKMFGTSIVILAIFILSSKILSIDGSLTLLNLLPYVKTLKLIYSKTKINAKPKKSNIILRPYPFRMPSYYLDQACKVPFPLLVCTSKRLRLRQSTLFRSCQSEDYPRYMST